MPKPELAVRGKIYSVTDLTREIKLALEKEFYDIWVVGEISNLKQPSSGHLYFTIKDDQTQLPAVLFRSARRSLRFRPQDGMAVMARGHITLYEPRGAYQIQVEWMEPRGKGALQTAFEQLKEKLYTEGLFAPERKRPIPMLPQRIGIVTSPTGAAIRDICRILHQRFANLEVVLYPAQVQGEAAAEIAKGIQVLNRLGAFDALIIGRGGGSVEDLWPFNEESVARAIAASRIPVISAVGHEIDFTIADFVADIRAPTPSAAAEMVVARKDDFQERLVRLDRRSVQALTFRLSALRSRVDRLAEHQAFLAVRHSLQLAAQRLDEAVYRAESGIGRRVQTARAMLVGASGRLEGLRLDHQIRESRTKLVHLIPRLETGQKACLTEAQQGLARAGGALHALSPVAVLARGYSLTWDAHGNLVRDASTSHPGEALRITLHRGELDCRVEASRPDPSTGTNP